MYAFVTLFIRHSNPKNTNASSQAKKSAFFQISSPFCSRCAWNRDGIGYQIIGIFEARKGILFVESAAEYIFRGTLSSEKGAAYEIIAVDPLPGTILWKLLILGKGYYHRGNKTDPGGAVRIGLYLRVDDPHRLKTLGFTILPWRRNSQS